MKLVLSILQIILILALAPSVSWWIKKIKASSQNRIGPALFQVYADLGKLFQKEMVISTQASWIFRAMPAGRMKLLIRFSEKGYRLLNVIFIY